MMREMTDERYRIPGTNAINFSKWSRENDPKPPPSFKVGDVVRFAVETEVMVVYSDCDGTALYTLDMVGNGWSEDCMTSTVTP